MQLEALLHALLAEQYHGAGDGQEEHLVEVHRYAVAETEVSHPVLVDAAHDKAASVGCVCMQKQSVLVAYASHGGNIIDGAVVCGADGGNGAEGDKTLCDVLFNHCLELFHVYLAL